MSRSGATTSRWALGSQPALFAKALASDADVVFLDLEDAVAPADKEQARQNVIAGLLEHDWRARGKTVSVRINGIDTHYMYRDVVDVVEQAGHRLDVVLLPKVGVPADVYLVDALLTQIELANEVFTPPAVELERARRILDALDQAAREGRGAAQLDGRMIDAASARMARNIVAIASTIAARERVAPPLAATRV